VKKVVAVGMSGGVDSSVTAYLLKKAGYHVVGLFMKNWDENDPQCPAATDYEDALSVAEQLDIPLHSFNFSKQYFENVFTRFLDEIKRGRTPNPDIWCNKEIKFNVFLERAKELGADLLATGHYARVGKDFSLLRGIDENKDQSYFLYTLKEELLKGILFPIGEFTKPTVRGIAEEARLATSKKKDSTGICFVGKRNFQGFLSDYIAPIEGNIQTPEGVILGKHQGIWNYTIGQRKGMGIGGPGDAWFVAKKNIATQTITVVQGEDHPLLFTKTMLANELTWVKAPPKTPYECTAKIRYRQLDQPCTIEDIEDGVAKITFQTPQRAATEGQSIVFYQGSTCLGGGILDNCI